MKEDKAIFGYQDRLASAGLQYPGVFIVHKVARAGCSMSLIKACCESKKKVVIFAPTIRILKQVEEFIPRITSPKPRIAPILSNPELCRKIKLNSKLKFQFKQSCRLCEYRGRPQKCVFQDLIMNEFDVYCLTYSKLRALQKSMSEETKQLLDKLKECDVFVFDEFTTCVTSDILTIEIVTTDEQGNVSRMSERIRAAFKEEFERSDRIILQSLYEKSSAMFTESKFWSVVIEDFLAQFEKVERSGIYKNFVVDFLPKDEMKALFHYGWRKITDLTTEGKNTTELQDVFLSAFAREVIITREDGKVKVTPRLEDALDYIREFCKTLSEDKLIFAVDSYQPAMNFDKIFGRPVKHELWGEDGDPLGTDRQQLILTDTYHWGSYNFCRDAALQFNVRLFIQDLLRLFPPEKFIIVTTNKKMAKIISTWNLPKEVMLTWHRSDWMRGVTVEDRRIMVCLGGPYLPKTAYVSEAHSFDFKDFSQKLEDLPAEERTIQISRIQRAIDTKGEFANAVGRTKDPAARERSLVITMGMTYSDVKALLKQTTKPFVSRPHLIKPFRKGGLRKDGLWIARLWFDKAGVTAENLPIVARIIRYAEEKKSLSASQVIHRQTRLVIEKAAQHKEVLEKYGVRIVSKRGGISFVRETVEYNDFSLDFFVY